MSIEDAIMGGIVFKGKKAPGRGKSKNKSKKGDVYSWTAWFRSCEDESGY